MSWTKLVVHLDINPQTIPCKDGKAVSTVTVIGETDGGEEDNLYEAFLKEDYIIPDMIWRSGEVSVAPNSKIEKTYTVELWCDKHCKVVGPDGSTHERHADVYAYLLGGGMEWQSDQITVSCSRA